MTRNASDLWTPDHFRDVCVAVLGHEYGWQTAIANRLGASDRSVRRWAKQGPPAKVQTELEEMARALAARRLGFKCRDEWIVGSAPCPSSECHRRYVIHTVPPRFIARAVAIDAATNSYKPYEKPLDFSGIFDLPVPTLCFTEVEWLDAIPRGSERSRLFKRALCALNDAADVTGSPPVVKAQRW